MMELMDQVVVFCACCVWDVVAEAGSARLLLSYASKAVNGCMNGRRAVLHNPVRL